MEETLFMDEEKQIRRIREANNRMDLRDLNKKNLNSDDLDEIFGSF